MATSYTSLLGFALPVTGELDGTWGDTVNNSITQLVEDSVAGTATQSVASGDWTLTTTGSGAANQARCAIIRPTGSPGVSRNVIAPGQSKAYIVDNQSNAAIVFKASATTGTTISAGAKAVVAWNGSDFVQVGNAGDVTLSGNNAFTGANTFYNGTGQTFGTATSTQDGIVLAGRAGGSSSYRVTLTPGTLAASRTATLPDGGANYTLGYLNIPAIADKTGAYTLAVADVGKVVGVGTGGSIEIPNSTFAAGDAVLIFNNTSAGITITCTITTAYIAGTDADKASVTLATRGVANILFISSTACVITGNVT